MPLTDGRRSHVKPGRLKQVPQERPPTRSESVFDELTVLSAEHVVLMFSAAPHRPADGKELLEVIN